jgi:hypothetical protein
MIDNLQVLWNKIQDLLDISGDCWMGALTATVIFRVVFAAFGHVPITMAESMVYGSAVTAFAYSNRGPK